MWASVQWSASNSLNMAMEATLVSVGMLPPIINTNPNSPKLWAKVSTAMLKSVLRTLGSRTYK